MGTHLNYIDLLMQIKWVPITYAFQKNIRRKQVGHDGPVMLTWVS